MALHFERIGLAPDFVNYRECLDLQREVHGEVVAGTRGNPPLAAGSFISSPLLWARTPVEIFGKLAYSEEPRPLSESLSLSFLS